MAVTFARARGEVDSAATVSWVKNGYLNLPRGQVFNVAERRMLERMTKKKLEGGVLDDVSMHSEHDIPNL
jgi:hypothetical protein